MLAAWLAVSASNGSGVIAWTNASNLISSAERAARCKP
jgi:hypothetical protein